MSKRRRRGRGRNVGWERAREHVDAARRLSDELGGTDEDVKAYLFSLSTNDLGPILDEYESENGSSAREYAEKTMPAWRTRRVHMSGLVAERLYKLLPPRMPLSTKFGMVETLWRKYGPRSNNVVVAGPDASEQSIVQAVYSHLRDYVVSYTVPEQLEKRFSWLAQQDASLRQGLLNKLQENECSLIIVGLRQKVPVFMAQIREHAEVTQRVSQIIEIGSHRVRIDFLPTHTGVTSRLVGDMEFAQQSSGPVSTTDSESSAGCFVLAIIAALAYWILS